MSLINLNLITQLEAKAEIGEALADSLCYNHREDSVIDPITFMTCIKRAKQADALLNNLVRLHKLCTDFANEDFQSYIDEHNSYRRPEDGEFDPFNDLNFRVNSQSVDDLPHTIEQYKELVDFLPDFADYSKKLDQGLDGFFGDIIKHAAIDEDGEPVFLSRSELPEDVVNEMDANREIRGISIEYCLDGYNEFYKQLNSLIALHQPQGTVVECAKAILALFAPYSHEQRFLF